MNAIIPHPVSLDAIMTQIAALEAQAESWPQAQRDAADARVAAVDTLNAEALRRLIRALKAVPGVAEALRHAAADEIVYAVLRRHEILKPSLHERVEAALETVRPMLAGHGGNVELVAIELPLVHVRFLGACDGCPASTLTFHGGVKRAVQEHVPEIKDIKQVRGRGGGAAAVGIVSPFARDGWMRVARLADLADGATQALELDGHDVLLSRFGDRVTCFENTCAHMGLAMHPPQIDAGVITCPHHGFRYDLATGACLTVPDMTLRAHAVRVHGDGVDVRPS